MSFTKLHASLLASSLMQESIEVRWLWVVMLAMANRDGVVEASVPGLAHLARLTVQQTEQALSVLASPDPYSRTKDDDGRRIREAEGGWLIVTYDKHRERHSREERAERDRERKARHRVSASVRTRPHVSADVPPCPTDSALSHQAEAEAEAEAVSKRVAPAPRHPGPVPKPPEVGDQTWADWLAHRKAKRAPVTATALDGIRREAAAAGMDLEAALKHSLAQGWQGFRAEWVKSGHPASKGTGAVVQTERHRSDLDLGDPACGCLSCRAVRRDRGQQVGRVAQ